MDPKHAAKAYDFATLLGKLIAYGYWEGRLKDIEDPETIAKPDEPPKAVAISAE